MRVAITGGTGFVGTHIAERFDPAEAVVVSRRMGISTDDVDGLAGAFAGCDVVVHCAGINREIGEQTFQRVHVEGTAAVIEAARSASVGKVVMVSFVNARGHCGSGYHESKFAAEELVRSSGLDFTVLKPGMIYGRGDHLVDHLSRTVRTIPLFPTVGLRPKPIRPIPVSDFADVVEAAVRGRLSRETIAVLGAEQLALAEAVRRVARVVGRRVLVFRLPVWLHRVFAQLFEWTMRVPLLAKAQVRMLAEGVFEAPAGLDPLPDDLVPRTRFTDDEIRRALPEEGRFGWRDLRVSRL
ncbi:MAG: NAD(P)H-binding protein [Cryobacterium sp.]|nr:NAD(P)H-binding protein [Cryobacterium sp.]